MEKVADNQKGLGRKMYRLISKLYPICRSITGNGVRQTLAIIGKNIPLKVYEVPSGTKVFDWKVPKEWNINDAYVKSSKGKKVIDFKKSNLHVVNYSVPVKSRMSLEELKKHLFTLPASPDSIPYKTAYYDETWGFCLKYKDYLKLNEGEYEVCIDSALTDGSLTFGQCYLPGRLEDEVLISTHICHPSLCNDNLSGVAVSVFLAKYLLTHNRKLSYRFLFIPGTIGSLTWLSKNESHLSKIKYGLVLSGVGDKGKIHYKKSRGRNNDIDSIVELVLKQSDSDYEIMDFSPFGYDERQYCSPGFNLPVGTLMRSVYGTYKEYHTSADNLSFVTPASLEEIYMLCNEIFAILENNNLYMSQNPKGEPQLGRRSLYKAMNNQTEDRQKLQLAMLWVLNLSDGRYSLLEIAHRAGIKFDIIYQVANILQKYKLLKEI